CNPDIPSVLAGHLTVSSGIFSGSEKRAVYGTDPLFLPSQLAIEPFDYVALGHLHRYQNLNPNGYPAIIYSGSIERIDFGERKEEKGFCVVKLEPKKTTHEFIKVPTRRFLHIEIQLKVGFDQTHQIIEELNKYPITGAIIKIVYYLPSGKKDTVDLAAIQRACSNAMHIVSILGIKAPETREKRVALKVDMDLQTLLTTFFEQKKELQPHKDRLVKKALELHDELMHHEVDETHQTT
ncbi:MAG TPA: hypothetical protein VHA52_13540, partial [Candidatus Babeliaceae bacterium]|nr:hypothetical protein [Candidatus Babeliaceae bacterium]